MTQEEFLCKTFGITPEQANDLISKGFRAKELQNGSGKEKLLNDSGIGEKINKVKKEFDDVVTENKVNS